MRAFAASNNTKTATQAVEEGLKLFSTGNVDDALHLFQEAQRLQPNEDEMRAALYNAACCLTKQKRWGEATEAVIRAVNEYDLKLVVALNDPDLASLRERREWIEGLSRMAGDGGVA